MNQRALDPVLDAYHATRATWTVRHTREDVLSAVIAACRETTGDWQLQLLRGTAPDNAVRISDADEVLALHVTAHLGNDEAQAVAHFAALIATDLELVRLRATDDSRPLPLTQDLCDRLGERAIPNNRAQFLHLWPTCWVIGHFASEQLANTIKRIGFHNSQLVVQIQSEALEFIVNDLLGALVAHDAFTGEDLHINHRAL